MCVSAFIVHERIRRHLCVCVRAPTSRSAPRSLLRNSKIALSFSLVASPLQPCPMAVLSARPSSSAAFLSPSSIPYTRNH